VWRFFSQKNSLWVSVVKALHGEDEKIGKKVQPRYQSTWLESLKLHGIDLVSFITPKLGNGANTSFWDVAWCGDIAFKNLVPRLYALWRWSLVGSGDFSVSSVRKLIDNAILSKGISKTRWIKEVPININVHFWKVIHDCLPTRFNISRIGRSIPLKIGVNESHPSGFRFDEVAILRRVWWLDICGIIPSVMLSPKTTYVAYLVFQITRDSMGLDVPAKTTVRFGGIRKETSNVYLKQPHRYEAPTHVSATPRKDGWMKSTTIMEMKMKFV
nr:RNA-directed DNA polymerase, eukaryota, reverse transcriptase zinc-binding domain protein [Tanacetum cinerariifolium]